MPFLIQCQKLSKSYRSRPLFENLSVSIEEGERLGIVGPNGAGKSTLMKIICGQVQPDDGKLISSKGLRVCYLPQEDEFDEKQVGQVLSKAAQILRLESHELTNRVEKIITQFDFPGPEQEVASLSGGWRKRLALARELIKEPELLLLDEPTNHLDLETVIWLEKFLLQSRFSLMLITHDRQFLENVSTRIVEINPLYENGCLSVDGKYSDFLMAKDEYMRAQNHLEQALASKVRKEVAWLQRGARARQTKSVHRIREAGVLMDNFAEVKGRNTLNTKIDIDFDATNRKTKELLVAKGIEKSMGGRKLFSKLDLLLCPGTRIGLLGANGSGKTTLLKLLTGDLEPDKGSIKRADRLRVVWFDQNREQLDLTKTLWKSLCPDGDSVVYRDKSTHVSTWARRFLFKQDQLHMPINFLSGGEQARILIANLMKQPADLLILDEPTNNLDLPSLEVLEESLLEFPGAVILVTHDRYMNMTVPNLILALDGEGGTNYFADLNQWEVFQDDSAGGTSAKSRRAAGGPGLGSVGRALDGDGSGGVASDSGPKRPALSTSEKKELLEMAEKIEKAEAAVSKLQKELEDPQHGSNHETLIKIQKDLDKAHKAVEKLYKRWEDLELRQA